MSFGIGPMELGTILLVALLVFGPHRLPGLAHTVGRTLAEFRRTLRQVALDLSDDAPNRLARSDHLPVQQGGAPPQPPPPPDPR